MISTHQLPAETPRSQKRHEVRSRRIQYFEKDNLQHLKKHDLDLELHKLDSNHSHNFEKIQKESPVFISNNYKVPDSDNEIDYTTVLQTHRPEPEIDTSRTSELLIETSRNYKDVLLSKNNTNSKPSYNDSTFKTLTTDQVLQKLEQRQQQRKQVIQQLSSVLHDDNSDKSSDNEERNINKVQHEIPPVSLLPSMPDHLSDKQFNHNGSNNTVPAHQRSISSAFSATEIYRMAHRQIPESSVKTEPKQLTNHFAEVEKHHQDLQRKVFDEWSEQKLRESNSRVSLDRYFDSLKRLSPRAEAQSISQNFEPVPDNENKLNQNIDIDVNAEQDNTDNSAFFPRLPPGLSIDFASLGIHLSKTTVVCPECGFSNNSALSWCMDCGCCLVGMNDNSVPSGLLLSDNESVSDDFTQVTKDHTVLKSRVSEAATPPSYASLYASNGHHTNDIYAEMTEHKVSKSNSPLPSASANSRHSMQSKKAVSASPVSNHHDSNATLSSTRSIQSDMKSSDQIRPSSNQNHSIYSSPKVQNKAGFSNGSPTSFNNRKGSNISTPQLPTSYNGLDVTQRPESAPVPSPPWPSKTRNSANPSPDFRHSESRIASTHASNDYQSKEQPVWSAALPETRATNHQQLQQQSLHSSMSSSVSSLVSPHQRNLLIRKSNLPEELQEELKLDLLKSSTESDRDNNIIEQIKSKESNKPVNKLASVSAGSQPQRPSSSQAGPSSSNHSRAKQSAEDRSTEKSIRCSLLPDPKKPASVKEIWQSQPREPIWGASTKAKVRNSQVSTPVSNTADKPQITPRQRSTSQSEVMASRRRNESTGSNPVELFDMDDAIVELGFSDMDGTFTEYTTLDSFPISSQTANFLKTVGWTRTESPWLYLPEEVWLHILRQLSLAELCSVARTCHQLRRIAYDKSLWQKVEVTRRFDMTNDDLEEMAACRPVQLSFTQCHGEAVTISGMKSLLSSAGCSLQKVIFSGNSRGGFAGEHFILLLAVYCPRVRYLDLSFAQGVSDRTISALAESLQHLESVKLNGAQQLRDGGLSALLSHHGPHLRCLELYGCFRLTGASVGTIGRLCPQLRELSLGSSPKVNPRIVSEVLRTSSHVLQSLDLRGMTALTNNDLGDMCANAPRLKTLVLANCSSLSDQGTADAVNLLPRLQTLDLCGCVNVGSLTAQQLSRTCLRLETLDLSSTAVCARGVGALCQSAVRNSLRHLKLNFCSALRTPSLRLLISSCVKLETLLLFGVPGVDPYELGELNHSLIIKCDQNTQET